MIVSGAPAAGKTTLGKRLAAELGLARLCKDEVREMVGDWLPPESQAQSRALGAAAYAPCFRLAGELLDNGVGVLVEAAFERGVAETGGALLPGSGLNPLVARSRAVLVHLAASQPLSEQRFRERYARGERHPAHRDAPSGEAVRDSVSDGRSLARAETRSVENDLHQVGGHGDRAGEVPAGLCLQLGAAVGRGVADVGEDEPPDPCLGRDAGGIGGRGMDRGRALGRGPQLRLEVERLVDEQIGARGGGGKARTGTGVATVGQARPAAVTTMPRAPTSPWSTATKVNRAPPPPTSTTSPSRQPCQRRRGPMSPGRNGSSAPSAAWSGATAPAGQ